MLALCELTEVSQERGFGSNHLVSPIARPQHSMGRWEARILGYTRYETRDCLSLVDGGSRGDRDHDGRRTSTAELGKCARRTCTARQRSP